MTAFSYNNIISSDDFSEVIRADFDEVSKLLPKHSLASILSFFEDFPQEITSFYGYEVQLTEDGSMQDVLFCIHRPDQLNTLISQKLKPAMAKGEFSASLAAFANGWAGAKFNLVNNVWFEYDYENIEAKKYTPNFFIGPSEAAHPLEVVLLLESLFYSNGNGPEDVFGYLLECYSNLPNGAWISQIGQMVARGEKGLRLFIQNMPMGYIPAFLTSINYPGTLSERFRKWLTMAEKYGQKVDLDLDLSPDVSIKLGVEVYCNSLTDAHKFLALLLQDGLCTSENYDSLNSHFKKLAFLKHVSRHHFLSHFKLVYDGVSKIEAKAYLGFIEDSQKPFAVVTKP